LSSITYDESVATKKYFDEEKATKFIEHIFKKLACFNKSEDVKEFLTKVDEKLKEKGDLVELLNSLENELINITTETEELKEFFTNPYNALFKDENGYYAILLNGKFSDVKVPQGFNANQVRKLVKESADSYAEAFSSNFNNDKEKNTFLNNIKATINKLDSKEPLEYESACEKYLFEFLSKKGVSEETFNEVLEELGLRLVKQGNLYFRKTEYETYSEYKKIKFRY
jgi:hypothetical protein